MADEKPTKKTTAKKEVKKIIFTENIKHNQHRYKKGESAEVSLDDYELLLKAQVIQTETGD
ncbi:DUF7210 family protein [Schinkia azotoformans]|uniref:DUF7210 family protein n=1 Tax=Schinkia azotoformans TaxID=1454 RepID=UPI002DB69407|nr:hypothetical protein [Schinkia azotoformans]MEC1716612.1 hypothetical protein [Schinkia azotoformans]MEC1739450.1 hypothetical protein [Schinkia azotoformans]MEC1745480.1 hypothetical protein [Schinkia azotoformans]MEC1756543.1 hypothetical protein [Schinkia azotoformans]MEC1765810.1 hypothetical protein [Schinkia azotoformans]